VSMAANLDNYMCLLFTNSWSPKYLSRPVMGKPYLLLRFLKTIVHPWSENRRLKMYVTVILLVLFFEDVLVRLSHLYCGSETFFCVRPKIVNRIDLMTQTFQCPLRTPTQHNRMERNTEFVLEVCALFVWLLTVF
jgi:hypothetical protein